MTKQFLCAFIIDDLWQEHFNSEIVIYTQKFIQHTLKSKSFLNKALSLVVFVKSICVNFTSL